MTGQAADSAEHALRAELARGDAIVADATSVLRFLLTHEAHALFSEATVARVRGMMLDLAWQLLHAEAAEGEVPDRIRYVGERQDALAATLIEDAAFLAHAQALVLEAELSERLQEREGIDPVLPPLVQELAAESDESTAALAMALLAAQARFVQHSRRMELPLRELPGDLFHAALMALRARGDGPAEAAERRLRQDYDEGASRLGLLARAVMSMGEGASRALAIDQAGAALFATALAMASGQERDRVLLSLAEAQLARLALAMRAAGLDEGAIAAQLLFIHPDQALPEGLDELPADQAADLIASEAAAR